MHRVLFPTGLGKMHFVADPFGFPLAAGTCIRLIGRNDSLSTLDRRTIPPTNQSCNPLEMLMPYLLQACQTWACLHALVRLLIGRCLQQLPAIFSHLFAQGFLSRLFFGKA